MSLARITVTGLPFRRIKRDEWDAFAGAAGASFLSSYDHLRAQLIKGFVRQRYRFFEFWLHHGGEREKIGQCVAVRSGSRWQIEDRLQLLPAHADRWSQAMSQLVRLLGPGRYRYGGSWSCEPSREGELAKLRNIEVEGTHRYSVQGVAFDKWPSWDRYWAKVSDSVRYEAKYAPERVPGLTLKPYRGLAMLKAVPSIITLQNASLARKKLNFGRMKQTVRHAYYMLLCWRSLEVVLAHSDEGVLAAYYGTQLGGNMHYIYGGQRAGSGGANWYLLQQMAKLTYDRNPSGRFLMGRVDYAVHDEQVGGGLLRARRALRVSDHETAMVDFRYEAPRVERVRDTAPVRFSQSFALAA